MYHVDQLKGWLLGARRERAQAIAITRPDKDPAIFPVRTIRRLAALPWERLGLRGIALDDNGYLVVQWRTGALRLVPHPQRSRIVDDKCIFENWERVHWVQLTQPLFAMFDEPARFVRDDSRRKRAPCEPSRRKRGKRAQRGA